jgi:elongation factor 1-gamma
VAKANKLNLEIVETQTGAQAPADYLKYNKLGKIPTFVDSNGYVLSECIAIAIYSMYFTRSIKSNLPLG